MKIHILPTPSQLQPDRQGFIYPKHNNDYGIEQDFLRFLKKNSGLIAENARGATWHYLPVFWTRWHLNNNYGTGNVEILQQLVDRCLIDPMKTFTICQYDDGPLVDLGGTRLFLASRKTANGHDVPLLSKKHRRPFFNPTKRYLASFAGRLSTHPIRAEMNEVFKFRPDVIISNGDLGSQFFVRQTLESFISLCPRGYGGSSFRFFESMQLGVVPLLIGDIDTRPFKNFIKWESYSYFANSPDQVTDILNSVKKEALLTMGNSCRKLYKESLAFQKWCPLVLNELSQPSDVDSNE
jgi:hypothetical protein